MSRNKVDCDLKIMQKCKLVLAFSKLFITSYCAQPWWDEGLYKVNCSDEIFQNSYSDMALSKQLFSWLVKGALSPLENGDML